MPRHLPYASLNTREHLLDMTATHYFCMAMATWAQWGEELSLWSQMVLSLNPSSDTFSCRILGKLLKHLTFSFFTCKMVGKNCN